MTITSGTFSNLAPGSVTFAVTQEALYRTFFPFSNDGFSQVFCGETAECVCQGLSDIFSYTGGVPWLLVFDNATGVGSRVMDKIKEREC